MDFFMQQYGSPAAQGTQGVVYRQEDKASELLRLIEVGVVHFKPDWKLGGLIDKGLTK